MSERDDLAKVAMQGILAGDPYMIWKESRLLTGKVAELAYDVADEMLRVRALTPKKPIPMPTPMPTRGTP